MRLFISMFVALIPFTLQAEETAVDSVVVYKAKRTMELNSQGRVVKSYTIALGDNPVGHKVQQGDKRTPEGTYIIDYRNKNSRFHRALHISYPASQDREGAKQQGVDPGGQIMIHGFPNGYKEAKLLFSGWDWTSGCIAVSNEEIDEIWGLVSDGTPITINP